MVPRRLCWIVWLLLWHSNGPAAGASGACASTGAQDVHRRAQAAGAGEARPLERPLPACADLGGRAVPQGLPPGAFGPSEILGVAPLVGWSGGSASLHTLVYAGDFVGFRALLAVLSRNENFPHLLTALQSNDERGMTVAHLLACAGRNSELSTVMEVLFRLQGDGVPLVRRVALETISEPACKGSDCSLPLNPPGLYAHGKLHFSDPPTQAVLFGDVSPMECAAAHGHVQTMKLLVQGGVSPGRVFEVAKIFTMTTQLHQAIQLANAEGFFAQPQIFLPSSNEAPTRQPRVRRRKAGGSGTTSSGAAGQEASSGSSAGSKGSKSGASKRKAGTAGSTQPAAAAAVQQQPMCSPPSTPPPPAAPGDSKAASGAVAAALASAIGAGAGGDVGLDGPPLGAAAQPAGAMSEALDIAALLLLTGMLLLPVWSTLCLLWRRAMRKRAAVQEPARRIKQAILAHTGVLTGSGSGAVDGAVAAAASGGSSSSSSSGAGPPCSAGSNTSSSANSTSNFASTSKKVGAKAAAGAGAAGAISTAPAPTAKARRAGSAAQHLLGGGGGSGSFGKVLLAAAGFASEPAGPDVAPGASTCSAAAAAAGGNPAAQQQQSATPSAAAAKHRRARISVSSSSLVSRDRSGAAAAAAVLQHAGSTGAMQSLGAACRPALGLAALSPPTPRADEAAQEPALTGQGSSGSSCSTTSSGSNPSSRPASSSGSRAHQAPAAARVAAAAVPAGPDAAASGRAATDQQAPAGNIAAATEQQQHAPAAAATAKQSSKQRKSAAASAAPSAAAAASPSCARAAGKHSKSGGGSSGAARAASASGVGQYRPPNLQQLRVMSADQAAQQAKAYVALIAPYTPSAAAAAARPAIYQPPGGTASGSNTPTTAAGGAFAGQGGADAAAGDDVAGSRDQGASGGHQSAAPAPAPAPTALSAVAATELGDAYADLRALAGCGVPAATIGMSSAATASADPAGQAAAGAATLERRLSGPAAVPVEPPSRADAGSPQLQGQLSGGSVPALQPHGSISSTTSGVSWLRDASVTSSTSSGSSMGAGALGARLLSGRLSQALSGSFSSDASFGSGTSVSSNRSLTGCSSFGAGQQAGQQAALQCQMSGGVGVPPGFAPIPEGTDSVGSSAPASRATSASAVAGDAQQQLLGEFADAIAEAVAARVTGKEDRSVSRSGSGASSAGDAAAAAMAAGEAAAASQQQQQEGGSAPAAGQLQGQMSKDMQLLITMLGHQPLEQVLAAAQTKVGNTRSGVADASDSGAEAGGSSSQLLPPELLPQLSQAARQQQQQAAGAGHFTGEAGAHLRQQLSPSDPQHQRAQLQQQLQQLQQQQHLQQQQQWMVAGVPQMVVTQAPPQAGQPAQMRLQHPGQPGMAMLGHGARVVVPMMQGPPQQHQQQQVMVLVPQQHGGMLQQGATLAVPAGAVGLGNGTAVLVPHAGGGAGVMHVAVQQPQQQPQQQLRMPVASAPMMLRGGVPPGHVLQLQLPQQQAAQPVQLARLHHVPPGMLLHRGHIAGSPPGAPVQSGGPGVAFVNAQLVAQQAVGAPGTGAGPSQLLARAPTTQAPPTGPMPGQQAPSGGQFDWSGLAADMVAGAPGGNPGAVQPGGPVARPGSAASGSYDGGAAAAPAVGADSRPAGSGGGKSEPWLTVVVPEPPVGGGPSSQSSESARMAAELDELLHQASQQLGWSAIPRASPAGDGADGSAAPARSSLLGGAPATSPASSAVLPALLQLTTPGTQGAAAGGEGAVVAGGALRLAGLEGLQLPDGFSASDA